MQLLTSPPRRPRSAPPRRDWPRSPGSPTCCAARVNQADPKLVAVVVSWLSGELPQRQIGVGWAALRSLPSPAAEPSLTVLDVDARFTEIGEVAGKGSQARRAELVAGLFARATDTEQTFLRRLLGGELRQGALVGVMADAVARAADIPAAVIRRAAMLGGDLPAVAAAALTGWRGGAGAVHPQGRPAGGPDARADRDRCRRSTRTSRRHSDFRGQAGRCAGTDSPGRRRGRPSTPAASTTSPHACPRSSTPRWRCPSPT